MEHDETLDRDETLAAAPPQEKRTYAPPKVESVRLSKEAAESLT